MTYANCLIYLAPVFLLYLLSENNFLKEKTSNIFSYLMIASIIVIGLNKYLVANNTYQYKKLVYDNTLYHTNKILNDIYNIDGFDPNKNLIVIMGDFNYSYASYDNREGITISSLNNYLSAISYQETANNYFKYILGKNVHIYFNDNDIKDSDKFTEMPKYPINGYVKNINNKIVVNLSY